MSSESYTPDAMLRRCGDGDFHFEMFEPNETALGIMDIRDGELTWYRIGKDVGTWRLHYCFDASHGFNLRCVWEYNSLGTMIYRAHTTSYIECQENRWYPERSVTIWYPETEGPLRVDEIRVTRFDDAKPKDEDLCLRVPRGTQLSMPGKEGFAFRFTEDRIVRPRDF